MNKYEAQVSQFEKTVLNLKEVLDKIPESGENRAVFRDSAIQRFEIAFDLCWKTLKEKLRLGFGIEDASPRKVFREAFKQGLIENETIWVEMTDMCNETSHAYSESFAESVLAKLTDVSNVFGKLLWKLKK